MAKNKNAGVEVFRDLYLSHPAGPESVREAVLGHLAQGWEHDEAGEDDAAERGVASGLSRPIKLLRKGRGNRPGVSLWMFKEDDGRYRVSNIVPLKSGDLGMKGYNDALSAFVEAVVQPAADASGLVYEHTSGTQSIEDWASEDTGKALKVFSAAANKSTGRSHPMDEGRWLNFLILAHQQDATLDSAQLRRWLTEVEDWPFEIAMELSSEYELARSLLTKYDEQR